MGMGKAWGRRLFRLRRRNALLLTVMGGLVITQLVPGWQIITTLVLNKRSPVDQPSPRETASLNLALPAQLSNLFHPLQNQTTGQDLKLNSKNFTEKHPEQNSTGGLFQRPAFAEAAIRASTDPKLAKNSSSSLLSRNPTGQFNLTEWSAVQKERVRIMKEGCEKYKLSPRTRGVSGVNTDSIVDEKTRYLYCPVEKSASTFFRRFMYAVQHNTSLHEVVSPFQISISMALDQGAKKYDFLRTRARARKDTLRANSTRLVVVREPFSRLYSAYVDKVLVPNAVYWKIWGVPAITQFRKSPSALARRCGNDVTFEEFAKYVVGSLHRRDAHVKPVDRQCAPCDLQFTVIAHTDTLTSDFQYLLSALHLRMTNFSADAFMSDVASDAIADSTYSAFRFYQKLKSCVSLLETCQRLWLKMQLRGIISEDLAFPLSPQQMGNLQAPDMVKLLEQARYQSSKDHPKLRRQKQNALRKAYASISPEYMNKLINVYGMDFDLFGFDKHPKFLLPE